MYELDWSNNKHLNELSLHHNDKGSNVSVQNIHHMALLRWEEHCLECIVPQCHQSCKLYVSRSDGSCARFVGGIVPNKGFEGILGWGAEIQFRPWAKLETGIYLYPVSPGMHKCINTFDKLSSRACKWLFELTPKSIAYGLHWRYTACKNRLLSSMSRIHSEEYSVFVMECYSQNDYPFQLVLEHRYYSKVRYRNSFCIKPGMNLHIVPVQNFGFLYGGRKSRLAIYPENNAEIRVVFLCLDMIKWNNKSSDSCSQAQATVPSAKIKCIAWDLDNTLWKGILIEDGPGKLTLRPEAEIAIKELDKRGIINTVVSKNNHQQAWQVIERMKLHDYFIYPAINWASKSSNIIQISQRLNIGMDSIAFIDDSQFERDEVRHAYPEIRVYSERDIPDLMLRSEFDCPVTEMSIMRRASYHTQIQREHAQEIFSGNHHDFLRSCQMNMQVFIPQKQKHILRCWELIQRTNQLNLSGRTYSSEEFNNMLNSKNMLCVAFNCADKFGEYGIVGFASIDEQQDPVKLVDFVISCRVAQKRIEYAFLKWLSDREREQGKKVLEVKLVKSHRNGPLQKVFDELPFMKVEENKTMILRNLLLDKPLDEEDIVRLVAIIETNETEINK